MIPSISRRVYEWETDERYKVKAIGGSEFFYAPHLTLQNGLYFIAFLMGAPRK